MQYKVLINSVKGLRKLVPYNTDFYTKAIEGLQDKKEAYESIYIYTQEHFDQFKKTNSLAGIKNVVTDKVVFDFDSREDLNLPLQDTKTLVTRLRQDGFTDSELSISYSSSKGFHVEIALDNKTLSREEFESITQSYAGDLNTFDTAVSDEQRVFRLPLSYNLKSGGYKIPLTVEDVMAENVDVKSIVEYSKAPDFDEAKTILSNVSAAKNKFVVRKQKKAEVVQKDETMEDAPDFNKNKTGLTNAKYALACGYFEQGERHEATMILAATYRALGWELESAYRNIKGTLALRNRRLGIKSTDEQKEELWTEVSSVYNPNWKGGTFAEDKNSLLIKTKKRYKIEDKYESNLIISLTQVDSIFSDFAENIDKNTLKLGINSFDENVRITTGTLVSLLAAPSVGKSSISFGILNSTSKNNIKSMFFSLDMGAPQVYQRIVQRHLGISSDKLFKAYQTKNQKTINEIKSTIANEYQNVKFCFRGAMNVDIIREALIKEKEISGEFPKLVVIDYLENVMTTLSSDPTISKGFVARVLKDMANEFSICILLLVQPAKVSGGPSEELNSYYGIKGSSLVAEASAQVITMHRPGFNPKDSQDDNFLNLTVVKNRMGQLGSFDYHWTGLTGSIRELLPEEKKELEALRSAIKQEKSDGGDGTNSTGFKKYGSARNGDSY